MKYGTLQTTFSPKNYEYYVPFLHIGSMYTVHVLILDETFCVCRKGAYGRMVECDGKECPIGWWHFNCAGLKRAPKGDWFCSICKVN